MNKYYCPNCKTQLISNEIIIVEDCLEHERQTPKMICPNKDCECCKYNMFWNDYGEFYSGANFRISNKIFPDRRYAALNSNAKKSEVEIFKNGLKSKTYLSPVFCFYLLQPLIEHNYKGDNWGNVLKKSYSLKFLKRDDGRGFCTYYTFPIKSLYSSIRYFHSNVKFYKKNKTKYGLDQVHDQFKPLGEWDKRWWRKLSKFYSKTFFKSLRNEVIIKKLYE